MLLSERPVGWLRGAPQPALLPGVSGSIHLEVIRSPALVPPRQPPFPEAQQQSGAGLGEKKGTELALPTAGLPAWEENVPTGLRTRHYSSCWGMASGCVCCGT